MLGEVEETIYLVDEEEDGDEVRTAKKNSEMLFVRGTFFSFTPLCFTGKREKKKDKKIRGERRKKRRAGE